MNLEIKNLKYRAGRLHMEIDFRFEGRIAAIFGPSGSGKTTLLELIAGFRKPETGIIRFQNRVLNDAAGSIFVPSFRRNIGYVPQDLALFPHLSAESNLTYGYQPGGANILDFQHVADLLELQPLLSRDIGRLSGGEKQRIAFGRAVLASPQLLLMDEPMRNLNRELKSKIKELILKIRDLGIPILLVSHDPDEIVGLCDLVMVIADGKNSASGEPRLLFSPDPDPHFK